jgi:hypothetical protein
MTIHAEFLRKGDFAEFAVVPISEFNKMLELIEDYEDLMAIEDAKATSQEMFSLEQVKARLGF